MKREENSVHEKTNGNNSAKPHSHQGDRLMERKVSTQCLENSDDLAGRFENSLLRKARYQFMKNYLKSGSNFELLPSVKQLFPSWTQEQVEQALDDVLFCGYARVWVSRNDGTLAIDFVERDSKAKTMKGNDNE